MQHSKYITLAGFLLFSFLSFGQSGNVGIGVDTPQAKLHISGTTLTDSLKIPTGARDGYIFTSDSLGNGYWAPLLGIKVDPTLIDAYQFEVGHPEYIDLQDDKIYIATDGSIDSLLVFDISDQSRPVKIGSERIAFFGVAQGLVVDGDYAYVDYSNRLSVYDISDPTNPQLKDDLFHSFEDLAFSNGYIYVVSSLNNALITINVQNPDSIFVVDTLGIGGDPNSVAIEDERAYIVDAGSLDLKIIDLSVPENPSLISSLNFGSFQTFVRTQNGFLYVTDIGADTLYIIDATDPENPVMASTTGGFTVQNGIQVDGNRLFISDSNRDSLYVFDVENPYAPFLIGTIATPSVPTRLRVKGDYVYLQNEDPDRLEVYRVSQNLVTTDINGETQVFDGKLPGLVTIGSDNFMDHLRLNRFGAGSVHLTATDPQGLMITSDDGDNLMYLDGASGNIGIGTDTPGEIITFTKLDVQGGHIALENNFGVFSINSDSTGIGAGIDTRSDDALDLWAGSDNRMRINPGGLVGIGTETPPKLLSLRGPDDLLEGPILQFTGSGTDQVESGRIRFVEGSEPNHRGGFIHYNGDANRLHIGVHDENGTDPVDDYNSITIHRNTGKVGIGNDNPIYDLDVFDTTSTSISLRDTSQHMLLNVGSSGASIRTVTNDDLTFWTNNTKKMTLTADGKLGIGMGSIDPPRELSIFDSNGAGDAAIFLRAENPSLREMLIAINQVSGGTIGMRTNNDLRLMTNGISQMNIKASGNVGIGTDSPASLLTVAGQIESTLGGVKFPDGTIQSTAGNAAGTTWSLTGNGGTGGSGFLGTTDAQPFELRTNNANRLHIDATGKIGLNTTATRTMLTLRGPNDSVNGPIMYMYGNGSDQTESGRIRFSEGTGSTNWRGAFIHLDGAANRFHIGVHDASDNNIANDDNIISIDRGTGKVGIGSENPNQDLTIFDVEGNGGAALNIKDATREIFLGVNSSDATLRTLSNHALSFWTNNSRRLTIETNGGVGIGTSNPTALLEVNSSIVKKVNGGTWSSTSDARLKKDIRKYEEGLDKVLVINPVYFKYNEKSGYNTTKEHIGIIAQEIREIAPHMVSTFEKDSEEYLQVDNSAMTYMLINAVKELHVENERLKEKVDANAKLRDEMEQLKKQMSVLLEKIDIQ